MRKIMILITIFVMALSAMPVYAEPYSDELSVNEQHMMCTEMAEPYFSGAFGTCKTCQRTILLVCNGQYAGTEAGTCGVQNHGESCQVSVTKFYASTFCPGCGTENTVSHSEKSHHMPINVVYDICWYK